ncbi:cop9 signalosome complex subunit [Coelomomyces lativittatus]|nr:cop9 signalosome complex subunit [Coelomomyces lativittatus]KAJ1512276.1 cop9 signalosome complex subunit [Coelomomyces lativittatus]KAJ1517918.1 cop9 signalosome complex subunit [Coelomomyces lativittatus]
MLDTEYESITMNETYMEEFNDLNETMAATSESPSILVENPNIDLETYIASYTDRTKIDRLELIALRCPILAIDAFKLALQSIQLETMDTKKYMHLHTQLNELLRHHQMSPEPADMKWIESTQRQARLEYERLETDLKNYKHTSIKESIRMGQNDLGDHAYKCGDFTNALKYYSRARDYCTSSKHILDMCLNIIKVSMCVYDFSHVTSYVTKAKETESNLPPVTDCRLKLCLAIAHLDRKEYKLVAQLLPSVVYSFVSQCTEVCTASDVAMYAGLCALATFERHEMKHFLENENIRMYLEVEPQLREILRFFYQANYSSCLSLLTTYQTDLYLFLHLHFHVHDLLTLIKQRMLVHYFLPYSTVELTRMATTMQCSVDHLELELMKLIEQGQLDAKIDGHRKRLQRTSVDHRQVAFQKVLDNGGTLVIQNHFLQLKLNMAHEGLCIAP